MITNGKGSSDWLWSTWVESCRKAVQTPMLTGGKLESLLRDTCFSLLALMELI